MLMTELSIKLLVNLLKFKLSPTGLINTSTRPRTSIPEGDGNTLNKYYLLLNSQLN